MKIKLVSKFPEFQCNEEIDILCDSSDISLVDYKQRISECIYDELYAFYVGLFHECDVKPCGLFIERQAREHIINFVKNKIEKNRGAWIIECTSDNKLGSSLQIDIADMLLDMLDEDSGTGEFDVRVGQYVEKCLLMFVEKSSWHVEQDIIWYGIDDQPLAPWSISRQTACEDLHFWFENDSWTQMKCLGDFSDGFLIWYLAECDYYIPDIDTLRNNCPIVLETSDNIKSIFEKVERYLENGNKQS